MTGCTLRDAIRGLAFAIAYDADAIANDRLTADPHAAALLLKNNADTLVAWTGKLREQEQKPTPAEPWCNHDPAAVVDGICECGAQLTEQGFVYRTPEGFISSYDHPALLDDLPEPGNRCKICGEDLTWIGPSHEYDWQHVADQKS